MESLLPIDQDAHLLISKKFLHVALFFHQFFTPMGVLQAGSAIHSMGTRNPSNKFGSAVTTQVYSFALYQPMP